MSETAEHGNNPEPVITPTDMRYRSELMKGLSDFLGVVAFAMMVNIKYPNISERAEIVDQVLSKWRQQTKVSRVILNDRTDPTDDTDVRNILNTIDMIGDDQFSDALEFAIETMRKTINKFTNIQ